MKKQFGISTLELLCSLTIMSSITAYTLAMSDEVETAIVDYQKTTNVKNIKEKIQTASCLTQNIDQSKSAEN
ncbi:MAG TPA: hypothetical protein PLG02_10255 [Methylotenera sp.]|nr:hypothetical protein [Methylotenera sp.]